MPAFAKTACGQNHMWPNRCRQNQCFKVSTAFGQTTFGQNWCVWCVLCWVSPIVCVVCSKFLVGVFKIFHPPDGPSAGPPKISLFFSLLRHNYHSFFPLLGVLSWNFGGVFEGRDPEMGPTLQGPIFPGWSHRSGTDPPEPHPSKPHRTTKTAPGNNQRQFFVCSVLDFFLLLFSFALPCVSLCFLCFLCLSFCVLPLFFLVSLWFFFDLFVFCLFVVGPLLFSGAQNLIFCALNFRHDFS